MSISGDYIPKIFAYPIDDMMSTIRGRGSMLV